LKSLGREDSNPSSDAGVMSDEMNEKSVSPTRLPRQKNEDDNISEVFQKMNMSKISKPGGHKDSGNNSFISGLHKYGNNKSFLHIDK
jgi:hypothetical protein